jgi:hypothetical protein
VLHSVPANEASCGHMENDAPVGELSTSYNLSELAELALRHSKANTPPH